MRIPKSKLLAQLVKELRWSVKEELTPEQLNALHSSRRKFLKDGAKGTLGLGLSAVVPSYLTSCNDNNTSRSSEEKIKIAIIGGGIAGLHCAYHLQKSNMDFMIFEANKRLGGRILTHYNDSMGVGIFPEFGGDFIDSNHEDMLNLVKEFNLETLDLVEEQQSKNLIKDIYFFDNKKISEKQVIKEFKKIAPQLVVDINTLGENYDTPEAVTLDNTPLSVYIQKLDCANWLKDLLQAAFVAEYGLDCDQQSTLNMLDIINPNTDQGFQVFGESDERYRIKGGNSKIIEGLVERIGEDKIRKHWELLEISDTEDGKYRLKFTFGNQVIADQVVMTLPFTILKNVKMNLKQLTPEKRKCIDELGYGSNTKLVLAYQGTPWSEAPNNAMGYLFHKHIVNGWDSSYNKTAPNDFGAFVCYFGGQFSEELNKQSSKNKMAPASHVWKTELPSNRIDAFVDELDKVFTGSKQKFQGKHVFVNWIDFPFAKASYSCYKVGQWSTLAGKEMEPTGNIYYAGEHCSTDFQGFMNGAAETGRRVAEQLIRMKSK